MPGIKQTYYRNPLLQLTAVILTAGLLLYGCAGAPVEKKEKEPEAEAAPGVIAAEVIADSRLLAQNGDYQEASSKLEKLLEKDPENLEALRLLASVYSTMGRRKDALSIWMKISRLDPTDPEAAYEASLAAARNEQWGRAREKILPLTPTGKMEEKHYLLLGESELKLGMSKQAIRHLRKASNLERASNLLGKEYYKRRRMEKAEQAFQRVIRLNPDNSSAHLHLGWIKYQGGDQESALRHYRKAVKSDPRNPVASLSLASLLEKRDNRRGAVKYYSRAVELPGIPRQKRKSSYNSLARLLVELGDLNRALAVIKNGLDEFPGSGGLLYQWGWILLKQDRKQAAREKFKLAARDPRWKEVSLKMYHSIR